MPTVRMETRGQAWREGFTVVNYDPETKFFMNFSPGLHKVALVNWESIDAEHLEDIRDGTGRKVRVYGGECLLKPTDLILVQLGPISNTRKSYVPLHNSLTLRDVRAKSFNCLTKPGLGCAPELFLLTSRRACA